MHIGRRDWDHDVIKDLFNQRDQERILRTPISANEEVDKISWKFEISGTYTVKSAYRLNQRLKGAFNLNERSTVLMSLWKIKAPPRTLNVVWRAIMGCLPTLRQLSRKRVPVNTRCPGFRGQAGDFEEWLGDVFQGNTQSKSAEVVKVCWAIWRHRNDVVWNSKFSNVNRVVASAKQYLLQWKCAQVNCSSASSRYVVQGDGALSWVRPQGNSIKVTVDVALFADREEYGLGVVARDSDGKVVAARTRCFSGKVAAEFAEALAIKEALSWIKEYDWQEVVLESDCLAAVQAVRSKVEMRLSL
ncbi:uncharacterized protein LOC141714165 [Apium graveolens]|uniref:uncharacterized protein LOC141714165 n=1 Tax=Apium graveolens TaxID=4045 RepID=UPI003D790629